MIIFWLLWIPFVYGEDLNTKTISNYGFKKPFKMSFNSTNFKEDIQTKIENFHQKLDEKKLIFGEKFNAVKSFVTKTASSIGNTSEIIMENKTFQYCFELPSRLNIIKKNVCIQLEIKSESMAIKVTFLINSKDVFHSMVSPLSPREMCFHLLDEYNFCLDPFESYLEALKKRFKICFELQLKAFNVDLLGINLNCIEVEDKEVSLAQPTLNSKENLINLNTGKILDLKEKIKLFTANSEMTARTMEEDVFEESEMCINDLDFYTKEIGWRLEAVKGCIMDLAHFLLLAEYSIHVTKTMFCFDVPLKQDAFSENFISACTTFTLDKNHLGVHAEMTFDSGIPVETTISAGNDPKTLCSRIPGFEEVSLCIKRTKWFTSEDEKSFEICLEMAVTSHNVNLIGLNLNCYTLENGRDFYIKADGGKPCKYLINLDAGKLNGKLERNKKIKMFSLTHGHDMPNINATS